MALSSDVFWNRRTSLFCSLLLLTGGRGPLFFSEAFKLHCILTVDESAVPCWCDYCKYTQSFVYFRRVLFYFPAPFSHFSKVTSYFFFSSKMWVSFFGIFLTKFYMEVFSFDIGRESIAGPAWKSTTDLNFDSITLWKRGRSARLGFTRSQNTTSPHR